jgi:hypothetical protein
MTSIPPDCDWYQDQTDEHPALQAQSPVISTPTAFISSLTFERTAKRFAFLLMSPGHLTPSIAQLILPVTCPLIYDRKFPIAHSISKGVLEQAIVDKKIKIFFRS